MSESEKPCSMLNDRRTIKGISWGETYGDSWWYLGYVFTPDKVVTRIIIYPEPGHEALVPWVAVYAEDEIVVRADCKGASIKYE